MLRCGQQCWSLALDQCPDRKDPILPTRGEEASIWGPGDGPDRCAMSTKPLWRIDTLWLAPSSDRVLTDRSIAPQPNVSIMASHRELITCWGKGDGAHGELGILIEAMPFLKGVHAPDPHGPALRGRGNGCARWEAGERIDGSCMAGKDGAGLVVLRLPDNGPPIQRPGDQGMP